MIGLCYGGLYDSDVQPLPSSVLLSRDLRLSIHDRDAFPQWSVHGPQSPFVMLWQTHLQMTECTMDFICHQDSLTRPSKQYLPPTTTAVNRLRSSRKTSTRLTLPSQKYRTVVLQYYPIIFHPHLITETDNKRRLHARLQETLYIIYSRPRPMKG